MSNSNKTARSNNKMRALNIGRAAILIAGFYFFKDLSKEPPFVLALVFSIVWFLSFYFYRKIPNKIGESASLPVVSILFAVLEVVIAVILKMDLSLRKWFTLWVIPMNIMGGILGFMSLYNALFFNIYPDIFLLAYPPPPPDPIATLPDPIQEIINEGRRRTGNITLTSINTFAKNR